MDVMGVSLIIIPYLRIKILDDRPLWDPTRGSLQGFYIYCVRSAAAVPTINTFILILKAS